MGGLVAAAGALGLGVAVLPWSVLVEEARSGDPTRLAARLAALRGPAPAWLRVDSPEDDPEVERALIRLGRNSDDFSEDERHFCPGSRLAPAALPRRERHFYPGWRLAPAALPRREPDFYPGSRLAPAALPRREPPIAHGELRAPGAHAAGLARALAFLEDAARAAGELHPTVAPAAIVTMFDKQATLDRLRAAGVPSVPSRPAPTWDETRDEIAARARGHFLKLRRAACAAGVLVLRPTPRGLIGYATFAAHTFADGRTGWANTMRAPALSGDALDRAARFLIAEGAVLQPAVPHLLVDGAATDLRVVVIGGAPRFTVWRQAATSHVPITNLHLGGRRADARACAARVPPRALRDALDHAARAARALDAAHAGVDLVFDRRRERFLVLEVNAFGDFSPALRDDAGRTVPEAVAAWLAVHFGACP